MYNGVVIGDIHNGVTKDDRIHNEINEVFIYHISSMEKLDFIIIDGDYWDSKFYLNDTTSNYGIDDMNTICEIAKKKNAKIRIVYGTDSHDSNQYGIFDIFRLDPDLDFKIIYNVEEEDLFFDCKVLYLPEEHIYSKKETYEKYFKEKNRYDFVFGHGVIQEVMTYTKLNDKKSNKLHVPVFSSAELKHICKGLVIFGHYHVFTNIDDKVFYTGSFSRWIFGEEEKKGFMEITKDEDNYSFKFIENYLAKTYKTFYYKMNDEIYYDEDKLSNEIKKIKTLIENNFYDYIRPYFQLPSNYDKTKFFSQYVKNEFENISRVKIKIDMLSKKEADKESNKKIEDILEKYAIVFDKSVKKPVKISFFIKNFFDKDISPEKIDYYLSRDITNNK